jgi:hypothetical protein
VNDKQILHDVLSLGMAHVEAVRKQLIDLNITEEDNLDSDKSTRARFLMSACAALIDIIHPAFPYTSDIFTDERILKMVEYYKELHTKHPARTGKVQCPCIACNNEHTPRITDQAEQV